MTLLRTVCALTIVLLARPSAVQAQTGARLWELEAYGGLATPQRVEHGLIATPPPGPPIVTSNPIFPSRQASSWFFGDGAALLNAVNAEFGPARRVTPLESVVSAIADPRRGAFGLRLRRKLDDRSSAEFSVNVMDTIRGQDHLRAGLERVRVSYQAALEDLLGSGPFTGAAVSATATAEIPNRRAIDVTAALNYGLAMWKTLVPYATLGGGVVTSAGRLPSATLEGRYRFLINDEVPIAETDRVTLRYSRRPAGVLVIGGGVRCNLSDRLGVSFDARMLFGADDTRVALDAQPSVVRGTPAGFIESYTNPAIQFSNDPATGRTSTLSGNGIRDFPFFTGEHQRRGLATVGVFVKF